METQAERFEKATEPRSVSLSGLVLELFEILDGFEISDEGRKFHPTVISSCRVFDTSRLNKLLPKMRAAAMEK